MNSPFTSSIYTAPQSSRQAAKRAEDKHRLRALMMSTPVIPCRPQVRCPPPPKPTPRPSPVNSMELGPPTVGGITSHGMAWDIIHSRRNTGWSFRATSTRSTAPVPSEVGTTPRPTPRGHVVEATPKPGGSARVRSTTCPTRASSCVLDLSYAALKARVAGPTASYRSNQPIACAHMKK